MTTPTPATRLVASTPEDLVAMVPVVLGFVPEHSVVLLTFGAHHPFHARLDLPPPGAVDEAVEVLLEPARRHGVQRAVLVLFAEDTRHVTHVGRTLVAAFEAVGIDVVQALRADGQRCFPLLPGSAEVPPAGAPYDLSTHRFSAQAVLDGLVTHGSREELAATLTPDPPRVAAVVRAGGGRHDGAEGEQEAGWVAATAVRHARMGSALDDDATARLLAALRAPEAWEAALFAVDRRNAADHVAFWTDVVRRSPAQLLAQPAALLGYAAWLAGHGALAWCAVDVCLAADPDHAMAHALGRLLTGAVPPADWDRVGRVDDLLGESA